MSDFATCPGCGLMHSRREDRRCPRCGAKVDVPAPARVEVNPFESPRAIAAPEGAGLVAREGNFGTGFALGFVLGLWGWIGALIFARPETKRGAGYGLLTHLALNVLAVALALALK